MKSSDKPQLVLKVPHGTDTTYSFLTRFLIRFSVFRSLRHRNYRLYFSSQLISLIGTWMQNVAQSWLVYELTRSSLWLGIIGFLTSLPVLLFSIVGGTIADRVPKRTLVLTTQAFAMVQAFALAILVWTHVVTVDIVGLLAFTLGLINAFDMPGRQAFIVEMVGKEDLANAIALNSAIFNGARIFGPAIGGILIGALGTGWCFFFNGISFLAVIIGLLIMKIPEAAKSPEQKDSILQSIREGFAYIRSDAIVMAIIILVAVTTVFGWSYSVLLPIFADKILGAGAVGFGNLLSANGIGALISALTVAGVGDRVHPRKLVYMGLSLFVVSIFVFAFSKIALLSMLCMVGVGMGLISFFATANSSLQRRAPDHMRGRVMGIYVLVFQGFFPFGSLGIGWLAHIVGAPVAVACGALVCGAVGFAVYRVMKRKRESRSIGIASNGIK